MPTTAPASKTAGNTNQACYFYEELPKIGRNPDDFGKSLILSIGARIYKDDAATTFDATPAVDVTVQKASLAAPNYQAQVVISAVPVNNNGAGSGAVTPVGGVIGGSNGVINPAAITPSGNAGHGSAQPHVAMPQAPGGSSTFAMAFASLLLFFTLWF